MIVRVLILLIILLSLSDHSYDATSRTLVVGLPDRNVLFSSQKGSRILSTFGMRKNVNDDVVVVVHVDVVCFVLLKVVNSLFKELTGGWRGSCAHKLATRVDSPMGDGRVNNGLIPERGRGRSISSPVLACISLPYSSHSYPKVESAKHL